jgi:hypothetical protein
MNKLLDDDTLSCPCCGGQFLHHGRVTIFHRERGEDSPRTLETSVEGPVTLCNITPSATSANPSSRRDGFAIAFYCEECRLDAELTFAQHKGQTLVQWRNAGGGLR